MGTITINGLTDLCRLAEKYGTDKLGFYTPIYDLLLSGRRNDVKRALEVGIGTPESMGHVPNYKAGASLRMWRDYFPNAAIYGMDINQDAFLHAMDPIGHIVTICADSTNLETDSLGRFDLIVDDGQHTFGAQLKTFQNLSRLLAPGGLYIIEDVDLLADWDQLLCDHTKILHETRGGTGQAILIRQEALNAV